LADGQSISAIEAAKNNKRIDHVERLIASHLEPVEMPLKHIFTDGLYTRHIFMPKGTILTSKIHKKQHPFVIMSGKIAVYTENAGTVTYEAPHFGVTEPGTRRVLYAIEDTIWITFHVSDNTDLADLEAELIEPHTEHLSDVGMLQLALRKKEQEEG
jgi:hypothetical protein